MKKLVAKKMELTKFKLCYYKGRACQFDKKIREISI